MRAAELRTRSDGTQFLKLSLGDRTGRLAAIVRDERARGARAVPGRPRRSTCAGATRSTRAGERSSRCTRWARRPRARSPSTTSSTARRTRPRRWRSRSASSSPPCRTRTCTRCSIACSGPHTATWELYRRAPAAKLYHQAYVHGLLEHCLTVAQGVSAMASTFPGIDRDVAVTGALLHDIGKLEAYTADPAGDRPHRRRAPAGRDPAGLLPHPPRHRGAARLPARDRAGAAAHRPQPPRLARARQPGHALHPRGVARAHDRQPRRQARLLRSPREGARARLPRGRASIAASAPARTSGRSPPSPSAAPLRAARATVQASVQTDQA